MKALQKIELNHFIKVTKNSNLITKFGLLYINNTMCNFQRTTLVITFVLLLGSNIAILKDLCLSKLNRESSSCITLVILMCIFLRKEVIQPQVLLRLPCYDCTPIADPTFGRWLLAVTSRTSGIANSHGVTGGVYKARERIHRDMLIRDY